MSKRQSVGLALCVLGFCVIGPAPANALTVHDPAHTAKTVETINELKKQIEVLQAQLAEMEKLYASVAGVAGLISSPAALQRSAFEAAQCLVPDVANLRLPDGVQPRFTSLCSAAESAKTILFEDPDGATYNGETLTPNDAAKHQRRRRDAAARDAVIAAFALAKHQQQTIQRTHTEAERLISEANAATDLVTLMRIQIKAQAQGLSETADIRALMAALVEITAARTARDLPQADTADSPFPNE